MFGAFGIASAGIRLFAMHIGAAPAQINHSKTENAMTNNVIGMADYRPHTTSYVTCMDCAHDWVAVAPASATGPLECSKCGAMSGEKVQYSNVEWFNRYMAGPDRTKRTLVLLNAKRMGV
jgi:hypothetical protein